jgi:hypothetical protein
VDVQLAVFTLRLGYGLRLFEDRVLRRMFVLKRDEVQEAGGNYTIKSFIVCTFHQKIKGD